jgi:hypothetical protein
MKTSNSNYMLMTKPGEKATLKSKKLKLKQLEKKSLIDLQEKSR